ncbi:DUF2637 domain-containing protein [Nocardia sp. BMG111209]|uniref:DUF2637 domain-containing protein n=1 Tax=Nocardia sp. BMG111209 TaxID=1160137 RepID=UPI0018CAD065|nr:DUF2637 domain-containing protein [Nocardia sp. BMG111209]
MSTSISDRRDRTLWIQCACTAVVAVGAAYASYRHGREFALRFGADPTTAGIWPVIVDGLLTLATVELWKTGQDRSGGGRWAAWSAFAFGICLSLCANIAAAPVLSVFSVVVAACPPVALLLAVELLNRALKRHHHETARVQGRDHHRDQRDDRDRGTGAAGRRSRAGLGRVWSTRGVDCRAADVGVLPQRAVAGADTDRRGAGPDRGHEQLRPQGAAAVADGRPFAGEPDGPAGQSHGGPRRAGGSAAGGRHGPVGRW